VLPDDKYACNLTGFSSGPQEEIAPGWQSGEWKYASGARRVPDFRGGERLRKGFPIILAGIAYSEPQEAQLPGLI